jgi:hypothetical protein
MPGAAFTQNKSHEGLYRVAVSRGLSQESILQTARSSETHSIQGRQSTCDVISDIRCAPWMSLCLCVSLNFCACSTLVFKVPK